MSVIHVHPDELLDAELDGELSVEQKARLDEHLARCGECRLERQLRADFTDELGRSTNPGDAPSLQGFVSGALAASANTRKPVLTDDAPEPPVTAVARARRRTWPRYIAWAAAAMFLFATGVAAAGNPLVQRTLDRGREELALVFGATRPPLPPVPAAPAGDLAPRGTGALPAVTASDHPLPAPLQSASPSAEPAPRDAPTTASAPATAPLAVHSPPIANATASASPSAPRDLASPPFAPAPPVTAGAPAPSTSAVASTQPVTPPRADAAAVFDRATAARRQGNAVEARALYRSLQEAHPASAEAKLSLALLARMDLDRGDTPAALEGFRAYLATGDGALREDAMVGRALALEKRGDADAAASAWRDLLAAFPRSAHSEFARERLRGTKH